MKWLIGLIVVIAVCRIGLPSGDKMSINDDAAPEAEFIANACTGLGLISVTGVRDFVVFKTATLQVFGVSTDPLVLLPFSKGWQAL